MDRDHLPGSFFGPPTLVDLLRHRARHQAQDLAYRFLVDGESDELDLTYAQLDRQARAIAAWLQALNLQGERVLLLYPPGLDFVAGFFGCLYAGVIAVTAYPPRRNRSIRRIQSIVEDADARVALTVSSVLERIQGFLDEAPALKTVQWLSTDQAEAGLEEEWQRPEVHPQTLAFLQYTSGSTGTPKGVMLTHSNLLHNCALIHHAFEHTRSSSGTFWLPSYHDMGLVGGILQPLYIGRPNVLMSPMSFLQKPIRWLQAISKYRTTTNGGPNFAYDLCVRKTTPEQRAGLDLSNWRVAFNGAEPIRSETLDSFSEAFEPYGFRREAFYPCYGLAEATLLVSGGYQQHPPVVRWFTADSFERRRPEKVNQPATDVPGSANESDVRALVSSGRNLPDQQIRVVDAETMVECSPGTIGEIWVTGPSVAAGYWKRPAESSHTFGALIAGTTGPRWLRTGDLGFLHEGELFVTGRIKDLIIVRGVNHYPQDIEQTVEQSHCGIRPHCGAAFAIESDRQPTLVVVQEIERGQMREPAGVIESIRRAVTREHELQLDSIVLIKPGSVPKTSSGKIQRHACRQAFLDGTLEVVAHWRRDAAQALGGSLELAARRPRGERAPLAASIEPAREPVAAVSARGESAGVNGHHQPQVQRLMEHDAPAWQPAGGIAPSNGNGSHAGRGSTNGAPQATSTGRPAKLSRGEIVTEVMRLIRQVLGSSSIEVQPDSSLADLGLDSLARVELQGKIEELFGGRFPEEVAVEIETVQEIVEAVENYLGPTEHDPEADRAPVEISPEQYQIAQFPEFRRHRANLELLASLNVGNPFFTVHDGVARDTSVIGGRRMINFSNYNYIGMSGDPVVTRAAQEAVARYGTSVAASRLVSGERPIHRQLERALADFIGAEDCIVMVGGHSTNETTIGHLLGAGDLILHDALAHNSIVQGAVLSGARRRPFPHNDWQALDRLLRDLRGQYRRVLVAIEAVYSMDGDIADLPRFIEVKQRHKALLLVDEAHSAGTLGRHGRGVAEHFGVHPAQVDIWMGTLSKSFASCGGYIAGSKELVEFLKFTNPGFVFSVGISPANAGASLAALELLEAEPDRVARLQANAKLFLELARGAGLNTGWSEGTPVVPVILGNSMLALKLSRALFERGINVQPILYPAVEESAARLRFFITSCHTAEQIRFTVETVVEELGRLQAGYVNPEVAADLSRDLAEKAEEMV